MKKIIKFYFDYKDYIKNAKQIIEQLYCEGYNIVVSFRTSNLVAVYTYLIIGE